MIFHRLKPPEAPAQRLLKRGFRAFAVTSALLFATIPAGLVRADAALYYPVMHLTTEERSLENQEALSAPVEIIDPGSIKQLSDRLDGSSLSLLSRLNYVPAERDQGLNGSCWVWAGTGIMEVALNVQRGVSARLSIQYLMSNYNGGSGASWAGNGGNSTEFSNFYSSKRMAIPWSNLNANYQDYYNTNGTKVAAGSIVTVPNYPFTSVSTSRIQTWGVGSTAAIANIKSVLNQNKAIYFGFFLANSADWSQFNSFWKNQPESSIWSYGFSDGKYFNPSTGGGHAVLCVGYDDSDPDPAKHYWIMVNSWGVNAGRPFGLFRVPMEYNYNAADSSGDYNTSWWTVNPVYSVTMDKAVTTPSTTSSAVNPKSAVPGYWSNN